MLCNVGYQGGRIVSLSVCGTNGHIELDVSFNYGD